MISGHHPIQFEMVASFGRGQVVKPAAWAMRRFRWMRGSALVGLVILVLAHAAACQRPPAVLQDYQDPSESPRWKLALTPPEQSELSQALYDWTDGRAATQSPQPAPYGVRWSDVPEAAAKATASNEMAVLTTQKEDWGYTFAIMTVDNYPGILIVRRVDPPTIYEAQATVGRFQDRTAQAQSLVRDLHREMKRLGAVPQFNACPRMVGGGD